MITARYPEAIFCAIETNGDSEANVQSRVLMDMFKARKSAAAEFEQKLSAAGLTAEEATAKLMGKKTKGLSHYPGHKIGIAGTAATLVDRLV